MVYLSVQLSSYGEEQNHTVCSESRHKLEATGLRAASKEAFEFSALDDGSCTAGAQFATSTVAGARDLPSLADLIAGTRVFSTRAEDNAYPLMYSG